MKINHQIVHHSPPLYLAYNILRSMRPRQWVKNLSVAAALLFSGGLIHLDKIVRTLDAILIFCITASIIYLINDVLDRESDRKHPFKRFRPIAAGKVTPKQAIIAAIILTIISIYLSLSHSIFFFLTVLAYGILQIAYSFQLKHLAIIDLFSIAGGFILRVYAGSLIIDEKLSIWLFLCVISTALLIAVGKRQAEITILAGSAAQHRQVLGKYSTEVLHSYISMFATASIITWALFTFQAPILQIDQTYPELFSQLPKAIAGVNKWLMITIPVVIYGIMRYIRIIYDGSKAESPERILINDRPLLYTSIIWIMMIIVILYIL